MTDVDKHLLMRVFERLDNIEGRLDGMVHAFEESQVEHIPELTRSQMLIVTHIRRRSPGTVRSDVLMDILYASGASHAEGTSAECLRVQIHRIRNALKAYGIKIRNQYGVGYSMPRESAQKLDELSERLRS